MTTKSQLSLKIPKDLRYALILHRVRTGKATQQPAVARASVEEVERALGVALPEELVATFAATGRDPYQMVVLTEEAVELDGLPTHLVAVGLHPQSKLTSEVPVYWCLASVPSEGRPYEMVRWSIDADERGGGFTVLDFVEACYLDGPPNDDERIAVRGLSSKFRPVLVDRTPGSYRRVWHHRFGSGFVLREYNDGNHKVEVDFPGAGTKLLLASYVRDAAPVPTKKGGGRRTTPAISGARAR